MRSLVLILSLGHWSLEAGSQQVPGFRTQWDTTLFKMLAIFSRLIRIGNLHYTTNPLYPFILYSQDILQLFLKSLRNNQKLDLVKTMKLTVLLAMSNIIDFMTCYIHNTKFPYYFTEINHVLFFVDALEL